MTGQGGRRRAESRGASPAWHTLTTEALANILQSDLAQGITASEARTRLAVHGPNALPEPAPPSMLRLFLAQFTSLIVWVLIGAALVSGLLQEWVDAGAILAIIVLNALLGFVQEFRAERSLAALRKLSVTTARVIREGVLRSIPARDTDGFPALALAVDPSDPDLMRRPPRPPQERFLTGPRLQLLIVQGVVIALAALGAFAYYLYGLDRDLQEARTVTFLVIVMAQLFHAFNCRSDRYSLFTLRLGTNKPLLWATGGSVLLQAGILISPWTRPVFDGAPFDPRHWLLAVGLGILPLLAMEVWKAAVRRGRKGRVERQFV